MLWHRLSESLIILTQSETWAPLKIYVMATISKSNESVKSVVTDKACVVLGWLGKVLENTAKGVVIVIALLAITFIFFNPLIFLPYCLLVPKKAADALYNWDLPVYMDFMQALYAPFIAFLPFRWKKHFMAARGIEQYSDKLQCRYFKSMVLAGKKERVDLLKKMSTKAINLLWTENIVNWCIREEIIMAGVTLTDEQFNLLITKRETRLISEYLAQKTPSEAMLQMLLSAQLGDLFLSCVERYGLSARLINQVFAMGKGFGPENESESSKSFRSSIAGLTQDALTHFAQRKMVRNTASVDGQREWGMFLSNGNELCPAAQKMMNEWQYDVYYNAGFHLCAEAIVHFFAKEEMSMCERIFKYEPKEALNEEAQALVTANSRLLRLALKVSEKQ